MTRRPSPLFWSLLVLFSGLIVAWRVVIWLEDTHREEAAARFHDLTQRATAHLVQQMRLYEYGLRGMRGALVTMGPKGISRTRVFDYSQSRDHDREFPGARGFGFIRRVPVADEAGFLLRAREDGRPDFKIRQLAAHNHERLVIQYIEPEERSREAVGLDIASETNRRDAALKAIRTGEATLTHPITLVQASGKTKRGFLLLLPVYSSGKAPITAEAREQSAYGLAYSPLSIDEILADFDFHHGEFTLSLYDQTDDGNADLFYESVTAASPAGGLVERFPLELFGRQWIAEVEAQPKFFTSLNHLPPTQAGFVVALCSLLLSGLLCGWLQVEARKSEAARQQSRLAAIVEGANDAIIGVDLDDTVTNWNPAAETIFGYPAATVIGRKITDLIVPAELKDEQSGFIARVIKGDSLHNVHTRRHRADGSELDVALSISPIRDNQGSITGMSKTIRDVSPEAIARRRIEEINNELESKVAERTTHLEASNRELADFAYLASHDLRTPLRAIDGFSSLLQREYEHRSAVEDEHLQRIRKAAQQMGRVIDDMVSLTQVVRSEIHSVRLDLSCIAQEEVARLRDRDPLRQVDTLIASGLYVRGDPDQMRILLIQLLDNAWKFTRDVPNARIEVGVAKEDPTCGTGETAKDGMIECFVRDNGIGFDMTFADRIFTPFQRLHRTNDYAGSGIGLAIVQRIVRKHGGTLRAESEPGAGATFFFSLADSRSNS